MEEKKSEEWLKNLPVQSENIGFQPEEMLRCARCQRTNPPNRRNCFYCAAELEISEAQSRFLRPNLRRLESWEKGFNVVVEPFSADFSQSQIVEAARTLRIETEILSKIFAAGKPLPVARVESLKEAEIAGKYLESFGIETKIVSDEQLSSDQAPRRLRAVEFTDDAVILTLFNQDEIIELPKEDLILIVTGAIYERRIEATESYRKKGDNKLVDSTETASDDSLIDIYRREDVDGFRIAWRGFDFSCLGTEKGILAKDNIVKLAGKFKEFAAHAAYVDDYSQVRELLATVWEVEQKSASQGLKRSGVGKFNVGNVTSVSNLSQFTKYSRLRRNLL